MPYCNRTDLEARFGANEISDLLDTEPDSAEDTGRLDGAIADADALIDGYLASRYVTPVTAAPLPTLLLGIACDITRYKLWDDNAPQEVRKRFEDAIKLLKDINSGTISLPVETPPATADGGGIEFVETTRVFTMDTLRGFGS